MGRIVTIDGVIPPSDTAIAARLLAAGAPEWAVAQGIRANQHRRAQVKVTEVRTATTRAERENRLREMEAQIGRDAKVTRPNTAAARARRLRELEAQINPPRGVASWFHR